MAVMTPRPSSQSRPPAPMRERNEQIAADRRAGKTLETLALEHGITRERVRQILKAMGDVRPDPAVLQERARLRLEREQQMRELRRAGGPQASYKAIGRQLGAASKTVKRAVAGVEPLMPVRVSTGRTSANTKHERNAALRADYAAGMNKSQLARKYGISVSAVSCVLDPERHRADQRLYYQRKRAKSQVKGIVG